MPDVAEPNEDGDRDTGSGEMDARAEHRIHGQLARGAESRARRGKG